jgi:hypothetical protein
MFDDDDGDDERLYQMFASLREHVVQIVSDLTERVQHGILAEDDGRFGPPSLGELLGDLASNATGVLGDLSGATRSEEDDDDR